MTMPAGKYYVGDLCYVMHDEWDECCGLFFKDRSDHSCNDGEFNLKDGRRFASFTTKWGDGEYRDQYGNRYGVDAGLIGCIRVEDIDLEHPENFTRAGTIIEFKSDFSVSGGRNDQGRDWDGVIRIGHVKIETDPQYSYEEEEV